MIPFEALGDSRIGELAAQLTAIAVEPWDRQLPLLAAALVPRFVRGAHPPPPESSAGGAAWPISPSGEITFSQS